MIKFQWELFGFKNFTSLVLDYWSKKNAPKIIIMVYSIDNIKGLVTNEMTISSNIYHYIVLFAKLSCSYSKVSTSIKSLFILSHMNNFIIELRMSLLDVVSQIIDRLGLWCGIVYYDNMVIGIILVLYGLKHFLVIASSHNVITFNKKT